jgi:CheY-like chemotaxis protein
MQNYTILWADDEIDLLKPHILFLESKGIKVVPVLSGLDAVEQCKTQFFDAVFLDENMPGMGGLEALVKIKEIRSTMPVVMITKSEEEHIMEEAIGSKISDYLIKPINPHQILLSIKKILQHKEIVTEKTNTQYLQAFQILSEGLSKNMTHEEWVEHYKRLVYWDMQLQHSEGKAMQEVLNSQWNDANQEFCSFVKNNYETWMNDSKASKPLFSHQVLQNKLLPLLDEGQSVCLIVIDNLRLDQWKMLESSVSTMFQVQQESYYFSILPTTTEFARNSLFAGLTPLEIEKKYTQLWNDEEGSRNQHEEQYLKYFLERHRLDIKFSYHKILNLQQGKNLNDQMSTLVKQNPLNVVVYNFVDMLSHARSDMDVLKQLAPDEQAYRSITLSWFNYSPLKELLQFLSKKGIQVLLTTDHGTVRVDKAVKIVGDRETNTNLRYKEGKNLNYDQSKDVFSVKNPAKFQLPSKNVSTSYVFAMMKGFFVYPNNFNHFVNLYQQSFQHGGVSMEEMIIPVIHLKPKNKV